MPRGRPSGSGKRSSGQPRLIGEERDAIRAAKKKLAAVVAKEGVDSIVQIIANGPEAPLVATLEHQREHRMLWQFALEFAADRGGGFHKQQLSEAAAEGIPPITVVIQGLPRPADT